jgi:hypothetical protein
VQVEIEVVVEAAVAAVETETEHGQVTASDVNNQTISHQ